MKTRLTATMLLIGLGAALTQAGPALAQAGCAEFEGDWAGTMAGRFAGPVTMTIRNCKVTWKLPDGRTNYCSFYERAGKREYMCSLGSKGTVQVRGKQITMRNTYTGDDYVVNVTRK